MRIAILESDDATAHVLQFVARRRGHRAVALSDFTPPPFAPTVMVVSLDGIGEAGLTSLERMRSSYPESLLYLTAEEASGNTTLLALQAGATDVIKKPFHPHELILRAELQLAARASAPAATEAVRVADLEVDLDSYTARKNGRQLPLTKLELRLLYCLAEHHGGISSIERMLSFGWESMDLPDGSLLKTHISHIRKKLTAAGGVPFEIRSRHSIGYELHLHEQIEAAS